MEFKLLLINILCKIAITEICQSEFGDITAAFTCLYQNEEIVQKQLLITLKQHTHRNLDIILSNVDHSLYENWSEIKDSEFIKPKDKDLDFKYTHKCLEITSMIASQSSSVCDLIKGSSANFDFDNVDHLIGNDSDVEESACKKAKLENNCKLEAIIKRLENDTVLLRTMKENIFSAECRNRIQSVCDELNSIIN